MNCSCNSNKAYELCCQPLIERGQPASSAEALMRSRYTAFTQPNIDYLLNTHHPTTRPVKERKEILDWANSVQWMGLSILDTHKGGPNDLEGMVEFKALYIENGKLQAIHEKSLFRKEKGTWYYVSGQHY
ncbi:YchJ family protein [Carboxylicivirga taeanensis]|uniref:YchJ family protein n=1 Tax=Carboxylicivirga taeanensis TaxID=1416875 RepID=UPI003F6DEE26